MDKNQHRTEIDKLKELLSKAENDFEELERKTNKITDEQETQTKLQVLEIYT